MEFFGKAFIPMNLIMEDVHTDHAFISQAPRVL